MSELVKTYIRKKKIDLIVPVFTDYEKYLFSLISDLKLFTHNGYVGYCFYMNVENKCVAYKRVKNDNGGLEISDEYFKYIYDLFKSEYKKEDNAISALMDYIFSENFKPELNLSNNRRFEKFIHTIEKWYKKQIRKI